MLSVDINGIYEGMFELNDRAEDYTGAAGLVFVIVKVFCSFSAEEFTLFSKLNWTDFKSKRLDSVLDCTEFVLSTYGCSCDARIGMGELFEGAWSSGSRTTSRIWKMELSSSWIRVWNCAMRDAFALCVISSCWNRAGRISAYRVSSYESIIVVYSTMISSRLAMSMSVMMQSMFVCKSFSVLCK